MGLANNRLFLSVKRPTRLSASGASVSSQVRDEGHVARQAVEFGDDQLGLLLFAGRKLRSIGVTLAM